MTSGEQLKVTLGLSSFRTVWVSRLIFPHTQKVLMVYYNSLRKTHDFPKNRCKIPPFTGMAYSGKDLSKGDLERPTHTPLIGIEIWNGDLNNYIVVAVDIAYSFRVSPREFDRLPESKNTSFKEVSILYPKGLLFKEVTIADLSDSGAVSDFTMLWRKDKNRVMGAENRTAKLIDCIIDEANKYVTFQFLTEATELKGKPPNKDIDSNYKFYKGPKGEVPVGQKTIKKNDSKTYEMQIRILDFFDWLSVFEGEEIGVKELKEIFETSDVQVYSTSPSFLFQGASYWLHQLGASIVPEDRKPQRWNAPNLHGESGTFLSKDLQGLVKQMPFFFNIMAAMLNKKLKSRNLL